MKHLYESVFSGALMALLVAAPLPAYAQTPQAPTRAEAQAALNPAPAQFTNAQLDQMLAPIALYPDQLLTQVLMATTFPDQLVDAQKWLQDQNNASLKGDDLANALQPLPWDPSVKSLVAFPQLIAMMTAHLDWTEALGTAFANQEVQVFSRVQFLRERAVKAGHLKSSSQIAVRQEATDIIIEPTNPDEIYVPVYNPAEVYGDWPDQDAPPVYIPPPPNFYNGPIGAGIGYSVGVGVVAPLWGWGRPDWRNHRVDINQGRYEHITNQNFIRENHINIEGGAWHRSAPVTFVPEAQRPEPSYHGGEPPKGAVQPSAVFRPGAVGPRPAGEGRPNEAQPGPRPAGEPGRSNEAAPGPRPAGEPGRPNEAAPGLHPPGQFQPGPHPAGEAQPGTRPEEHGPPGGPPHPEERAAPQGGPPHPEEHAAPQGGPPHPEERAAPQGGPPHPEERAAPQGGPPHPEEHAPPQQAPHPAAPPPQAPHPAAPPPQAPHPEERAAPQGGPPPQAPHPAGPPPQAQHPAPQGHPAPAKPGEEHKDEPQH